MSKVERLTWGRNTVETACPLDCPDACSLGVHVENARVVAIDGTTSNPDTAGFICAKVRRFHDRVYGEHRLKHPAVRTGPKGRGSFARVGWDEALGLVADRLRAARDTHGGESILPFYYGGSNGFLTQHTTDLDLFRRLGASRLLRTFCAAATGAAAETLYGKMPGVAYGDYVHARLIVLWGVNPSTSGIHLVPYLREAQKRGARLVVIDPRETSLARLADLHLPIRPGTDLPVALSMIAALFETGRADDGFLETHATGVEALRERAGEWSFERAAAVSGVPAEALARVTDWYAESSPALIRCGWGLERNRNGGSAVAAVLALPAVAGKFGVRGGGYTLSNSSAWGIQAEAWQEVNAPATRTVNMSRLGRALVELASPPVSVLFVYNANPVATAPDQNRVIQGLGRQDLFTVVFDQVMTDTAAYADVILPATTFLEHWDIGRGYGSYALQLVKPVIEPEGEARPNGEVFSELAVRLGLRAEAESETETLLRVAQTFPDSLGERLLDGQELAPPAGAAPVQFLDVFPNTPGGRIRLCEAWADETTPEGLYGFQPDPATADYPLALISPATEKTISSTLGELQHVPATLYVHQDDAEARGIGEGDVVRVYNALGEVHCRATVGPRIARGTVSLPKGLWRRHTLNESTANALVPDHVTDLGAGACYNDARVEVVRVMAADLDGRHLGLWVPADGSTPVN
jgi:anaerobic selenocysteine-containing dehydrogenase